MVSTGENPLPVGTIVGEASGLPRRHRWLRRRPTGAHSGVSSALESPERMQSGGLRLARGFRYMLPPGTRRVGEMNGELGMFLTSSDLLHSC